METPLDQRPRLSVRMDAALDQKTRAKLEELAMASQRSRAAVLRQVMQWGLGQKGPITYEVPRHITSFFFMVDAALHQQVREAAQSAGSDVAPWLRHMMRQTGRRTSRRAGRRGGGTGKRLVDSARMTPAITENALCCG